MNRSVVLIALVGFACATAKTAEQPAAVSCEPSKILADSESPVAAARTYLRDCGRDEVIELTRELVAFRTVSARGLPPDNPSFAETAAFLEKFSRDAGLKMEVFGDNDAWEIQLGEGPRKLGFVMHVDVVPATALDQPPPAAGVVPEGWTHPPFEATLSGNRLYGRGTEDDKAPIAAALVVLRTLKRFGLSGKGQMMVIIGTGEESSWKGMHSYAESTQQPEYVVSIDAGFPVVVAESGFVAWEIGQKLDPAPSRIPGAKARALDVEAGQFLTQVPGAGRLEILPPEGQSAEAYRASVDAKVKEVLAATKDPGFGATVSVLENERVALYTSGQAVHSSTAEEGKNALWLLARIAHQLDLEDNAIAAVLRVVAERFDGDHFGTKLGLAYEHPAMKPLLVIPTVLRVKDGNVSLSVNMRRPMGPSSEDFLAQMRAALETTNQALGTKLVELDEPYVGEAAMADVQGPLVSTLMDIYRENTQDQKAEPVSIRGGTYARLFKGAVSFGPAMPGSEYTGHAPDEYIDLDTLDHLTQMLFEACLRLGEVQMTEPTKTASTEGP